MPDDLASRVVPDIGGSDPTSGLGTAVVAGFQGDSGNDNVQRVYLTPDCMSAYVEFPKDVVVTSQEIGNERSLFTGTAYWLPKNQDLTCWIAAPTTAKNLDAPQLATLFDARAASGAAAAGTQERFIGEAMAVGSALWGAAGALGLQDDIGKAAGSAVNSAVSTVKSWFGW